MEEILNFIYENIGQALLWLVVGSGIIQITPIKWNPWSWIAKKVGGALNADLKTDIKKVETKVDMVEQQLEMHRKENAQDMIEQARLRILRFSDEITEGKHHSQEHYDDILKDIDKYEKYCLANPEFPNNKAVMAVSNIKDKYAECLKEGKF